MIAAASALSPDFIQPALIIKSIRIFMIAPIVFASTYFLNRFESREGNYTAKVSVPTFAVVFLINSMICAGLNYLSTGNPLLSPAWMWIQTALKSSLIPFLLAIAFVGVGSKVKFSDIAKVGLKPFGFAALMAVVAGALALAMAVFIAPYIA